FESRAGSGHPAEGARASGGAVADGLDAGWGDGVGLRSVGGAPGKPLDCDRHVVRRIRAHVQSSGSAAALDAQVPAPWRHDDAHVLRGERLQAGLLSAAPCDVRPEITVARLTDTRFALVPGRP